MEYNNGAAYRGSMYNYIEGKIILKFNSKQCFSNFKVSTTTNGQKLR